MEIEIGEEGKLCRGVIRPIRVPFRDRDAVVEVEQKFYGEKTEKEADPVFDCARSFDTCWRVFDLRDVVVEGYDWACEIQGSIDCVGEVVSKRIVFRTSWS